MLRNTETDSFAPDAYVTAGAGGKMRSGLVLSLVLVSSVIGSASTTSERVLLYILHFESRRTHTGRSS